MEGKKRTNARKGVMEDQMIVSAIGNPMVPESKQSHKAKRMSGYDLIHQL
jgi:hypothetical protein